MILQVIFRACLCLTCNYLVNWAKFIAYLARTEQISPITTLLRHKPELVDIAIDTLNTDKLAKYATKLIDNFTEHLRPKSI